MFSHEDVRAILESWGHVYILLSGGSRRSAAYPGHPFAGLFAKGSWFEVADCDDEICREGERCSVDHFRGGALQVFFEGCPDVKEDMGELVDPPPVGGGGCQGLLHMPVESLDHAVGAGVVGGRPNSLGTE